MRRRLGGWLGDRLSARQATLALKAKKLPLVWPEKELPLSELEILADLEPALVCGTFLEARTALAERLTAAILPGFLAPDQAKESFTTVRVPALESRRFQCCLAWNPRLLRLNPRAVRQRDALLQTLTRQLAATET